MVMASSEIKAHAEEQSKRVERVAGELQSMVTGRGMPCLEKMCITKMSMTSEVVTVSWWE